MSDINDKCEDKNPFKMPDDYFDGFADKVMNKIHEKDNLKTKPANVFKTYFWLVATFIFIFGIGKLIIPTKLEFIGKTKYITTTKKCSATLVSLNEKTGSSTIITAAHCLSSHNKKAGPMQFIIKEIQML